ncbi:Neutral ceramidase [Durusdinium trenchii]|uniref:Neutral ceramidase n=1 Tax=Durusdinium trenchii TaxID=1381693 RepID=A0ABP0HWF9_9DINO
MPRSSDESPEEVEGLLLTCNLSGNEEEDHVLPAPWVIVEEDKDPEHQEQAELIRQRMKWEGRQMVVLPLVPLIAAPWTTCTGGIPTWAYALYDIFTDGAMPWQAAACDPEATNHFVAAFEGAGPSQLFQPLAQWLGLPGLLALTFLFATAVQQARFSTGSPDNAAALAADVVGLHGLATYFEKRDGSGRASNVVVYKVLAENLPQLFLQTAFLSAAFARFDGWGRLKIMVSLGLGLISATLKLSQMAMAMISIMWRRPERRGSVLLGLLVFALPGFLMVAWVVARIIMAHKCPSHQWNLATGCV